MIVYVEYVLINNFVIDAMLLYWAHLSTKKHIKIYKILIASSIGSVIAVLSPFCPKFIKIVIKLLTPILIGGVFIEKNNIKNCLKIICYMLFYTALLGGVMLSLYNFGYYDIIVALNVENSFVLSLVGIVAIVGTYIVKRVTAGLAVARRKKLFFCKVSLVYKGKLLDTEGYFDSGNTLYYKNCNPVVVVDRQLASEIGFEDEDKFVMMNTVVSKKKKPVYPLDKLKVFSEDGTKDYANVWACVSDRKLEKYKIILHCDM